MWRATRRRLRPGRWSHTDAEPVLLQQIAVFGEGVLDQGREQAAKLWAAAKGALESTEDGLRSFMSTTSHDRKRQHHVYPIPDHDSGHSVQGGAAAESLKQFFGTDDIAFSACSLTLPVGERCTDASPVFRTYTSFSQSADENGLSRILVGIRFRNAVEEGIQHGRKIAKRAANLLLKPVD